MIGWEVGLRRRGVRGAGGGRRQDEGKTRVTDCVEERMKGGSANREKQ